MKVSLKEVRARANLTQAQFAKMIGVNTTTYSMWESLKQSDIDNIAKILGMKPGDIEVPSRF